MGQRLKLGVRNQTGPNENATVKGIATMSERSGEREPPTRVYNTGKKKISVPSDKYEISKISEISVQI